MLNVFRSSCFFFHLWLCSEEKISYLNEIRKMAPSHFIEEYAAQLMSEDNGSHPILLQIAPFDIKQPGLRFTSATTHKPTWKHMAKIDDIYSIHINGDIVKIASSYSPTLFCVKMDEVLRRDSFVSCLTVYYRLVLTLYLTNTYIHSSNEKIFNNFFVISISPEIRSRLMCKWTMSLCRELHSISLTELEINRCHGPIGGEYAYRKLKQQCVGSYILRQCEKIYENYYIDIMVKL